MKIIIYPDYETDLSIYESLASEVVVYDDTGSINTKFEKTDSIELFSNVDAVIFTQNCVVAGEYDTTKLKEACIKIQNCVLDDVLLILDTKVPPRTVFKMSKVIDEYELIPDIKLAYTTVINDNLRIIAGKNKDCLNKCVEIYTPISEEIRTVKHIQTAEFIPILQNVYKDTLIALANETAILSEALTIDLTEAIDVANTNEEINLLYPKPVLMHDISRDSEEINKLANEYGEPSLLSETIRNTNNYVAYHIAYMAEKELYLKEHLAMFETTVAILGITEDDRLISQKDNASLTLVDDFVSRDVEVWVHDDKVDEELIEEHGAKKITLNEAYDADCIIVMTDTPEYRQLDPNKIEKVIITALPIFNQDEFDNVKYSCVGHYRLKEGEML
jgi:UDP-N-acetyl-D-mannosaminuronate dehydrogenase